MNVNERLSALRKQMQAHEIDAYFIPSSDPHNSEYAADHWKSREWISGFTGSAGFVLVTQEHAGLWTDSRYFISGAKELESSEFVLHKLIQQGAPEHHQWIEKNLKAGSTIGFDGSCLTKGGVEGLAKLSDYALKGNHDLIDPIWSDRPNIPDDNIFIHEEKYSGQSTKSKLAKIQEQLVNQKLDGHLVTTLDDIAWIFNIRGKDVSYNPVAIAYAVIEKERAILFMDGNKIDQEIKEKLTADGVQLRSYNEVSEYLKSLNTEARYLVDKGNCNALMYDQISAQVVIGKTISRALKAVKNRTEIAHTRKVMAKDGAALAKTFKWLEKTIETGSCPEYSVLEKLAENRSLMENYKGESFGAIVGYQSNGAIMHYAPKKDDCFDIKKEGVLLVDSGGQYLDGTTDITRTFALSDVGPEVRRNFTLVLKGMIALTKAKFPPGTTGAQLDTFARQFLWQEGLNFSHGTGHGVGFFLNVHEPPQGFAPSLSLRGRTKHVPGMITSNEPGYYQPGDYGIRIENLILTVENPKTGFLEHETLSYYPMDHNMMDLAILTPDEISWLNNYHKDCFDKISVHLNESETAWFSEKCKPIA